MGLDAVAKLGLRLIANKNGVQVYQGLSKNGARITASYRNGIPYKLITQNSPTYSKGILGEDLRRTVTNVENYATGNTTTIKRLTEKNSDRYTHLISHTNNRAGNCILTRDITHTRYSDGSDYTDFFIQRYNPNSSLMKPLICYSKGVYGRPSEYTVVVNNWKGLEPGFYSPEGLNRLTNSNEVSKIGYIS